MNTDTVIDFLIAFLVIMVVALQVQIIKIKKQLGTSCLCLRSREDRGRKSRRACRLPSRTEQNHEKNPMQPCFPHHCGRGPLSCLSGPGADRAPLGHQEREEGPEDHLPKRLRFLSPATDQQDDFLHHRCAELQFHRDSHDLKVIEGEHTGSLAVGQRVSFDTDSIDLSIVNWAYNHTGQRDQYGGSIRGYCVEVYSGGRLLASDVQPPDARMQIQQAKAKQSKGK
jgi:hypothetical protein